MHYEQNDKWILWYKGAEATNLGLFFFCFFFIKSFFEVCVSVRMYLGTQALQTTYELQL